jgi:hypothetical protein
MTTTEKIAATYLRLNGFFLLPLFTVFDGAQHNHIDLLGLRAAGSAESINGISLPVDGDLLLCLTKMGATPNETVTGIIVEVKTANERDVITLGHIDYAKRFMNTNHAYPIWFYGSKTESPKIEKDHLRISMQYAMDWIIYRFDKMNGMKDVLAKQKSWAWSEEFLSDLLMLRTYGAFHAKKADDRQKNAKK